MYACRGLGNKVIQDKTRDRVGGVGEGEGQGWDGMRVQRPLSRLEVVQVTCREWVPPPPPKVLLAGES